MRKMYCGSLRGNWYDIHLDSMLSAAALGTIFVGIPP